MGHEPSKPVAPTSGEHKPFVPAETEMPEFTLKAILLGSFFGILFGAVTVYLALRAGLTVSASIPIAVLSIAVFKKIGNSTILENNIVQTIGSAGESIAAGVVFTTPAFLFLAGGEEYFHALQIMTLAAVGGCLGVLMMVPMRRALIVQEHANLPYPEGTACADVLMAGEKGGAMAKMVFSGFWVAMGYTFLMNAVGLWKGIAQVVTSKAVALKNATVSCAVTPEYLGVGYIIGPRIGGVMVSGSVLSWVALIPLLSMLVPDATVRDQLLRLGKTPDEVTNLLANNTPKAIYEAYIRYIGAGAVAMAGIMTLIRTMPTIFASIRDSMKTLVDRSAGTGSSRTEREFPITWAAGGSVLLVLIIAILPNVPAGGFPRSLVTGLMVLVFGFIFVAVSSRVVGLIGSSSNPISGMTIATLLGTCLVFLAVGMGGDAYQGAALCVGSIVCIAAANAGATSQDLKTGFLVGGTPFRQQVGEFVGVFASVAVIGLTLVFMNESEMGPIGGEQLPAPQGVLMATIIKGVLSQDLPWGFIFVGAALAVVVQLCGVSALAWAVGAYLPISTTFPIFIGGCMRWLSDRIRGKAEESEVSSGMLFSTGLVAGGSIAGLLLAILTTWGLTKGIMDPIGFAAEWDWGILGGAAEWSGAVAFALLCAFLVRQSLRKVEG